MGLQDFVIQTEDTGSDGVEFEMLNDCGEVVDRGIFVFNELMSRQFSLISW